MRIAILTSLRTLFHKKSKSNETPLDAPSSKPTPLSSKAERKKQQLQQKQSRREAKQNQQDTLRQTDPEGLLKIALKPGPRRRSFTAADPARFYCKEGHWTDHLASEGVKVRDWAQVSTKGTAEGSSR